MFVNTEGSKCVAFQVPRIKTLPHLAVTVHKSKVRTFWRLLRFVRPVDSLYLRYPLFRNNRTLCSVGIGVSHKKAHWRHVQNCISSMHCWGTRWRIWLRHCAKSWRVAISIPDGDIGIFRWLNPSDLTMALRSTQPLKETSTRSIRGVKAAGA